MFNFSPSWGKIDNQHSVEFVAIQLRQVQRRKCIATNSPASMGRKEFLNYKVETEK